mgnify:CR=1 FL=1|jgi:hypothetical protein
MKKLLIFIFLIITNLHPCKWCGEWDLPKDETPSQTVQQEEKIEAECFEENEDSNLEDILNFLIEDEVDITQLENVGNLDEPAKKFYLDYLSKYYPKALVIVDCFYKMCPVAIAAALGEVVEILSCDEWFYYKDRQQDFASGEFWEITLGQCLHISRFLNSALVNLKDNTVYKDYESLEDEEDKFGGGGEMYLCDYFRQRGVETHFYFYAEYADRLVKMFNEGILNFDLMKAYRYHVFLSRVIKKLRGFCDCVIYEEVTKKQKELIAILRQNMSYQS